MSRVAFCLRVVFSYPIRSFRRHCVYDIRGPYWHGGPTYVQLRQFCDFRSSSCAVRGPPSDDDVDAVVRFVCGTGVIFAHEVLHHAPDWTRLHSFSRQPPSCFTLRVTTNEVLVWFAPQNRTRSAVANHSVDRLQRVSIRTQKKTDFLQIGF